MAENWDLSAVVNSTPATNCTFSENVNSDENPLEFLNHLTFGDDDGLHCFPELEPPICTGVQDAPDSFCDLFSVPTSTDDHDAPQGVGNNILNPTPISSDDFQELPPQNHSSFILQDYQQQQQNHQVIHPNFSGVASDPNCFISNSFQEQFEQGERPFLQPPPLLQQPQAAPPIPIPRLPTKPAPRRRSRRNSRKCNQKRKVEQVPADRIDSDIWSWRKYGQKPIKDSPYPRNYYRCSSSKGCTARKQVEKSNTDPDMFIVCYTGDHNHTRSAVNRNSLPGSRYRYLGRTNFHIPLLQAYEACPIAPPTSTVMGSTSYLSQVLSAPSLYPRITPPSTFKDYIDNGVGAARESHVGTSNDGGLIPKLGEVKN